MWDLLGGQPPQEALERKESKPPKAADRNLLAFRLVSQDDAGSRMHADDEGSNKPAERSFE